MGKNITVASTQLKNDDCQLQVDTITIALPGKIIRTRSLFFFCSNLIVFRKSATELLMCSFLLLPYVFMASLKNHSPLTLVTDMETSIIPFSQSTQLQRRPSISLLRRPYTIARTISGKILILSLRQIISGIHQDCKKMVLF